MPYSLAGCSCLTTFICSASPNWPEPAATMSLILQRLKDRTARRILAALRKHPENSCCRKMRARCRLPPSVPDESHDRVWQRRFYPFNVDSEKKRLEKLDDMHNNPVQRGLVSSPHQWPWSSKVARTSAFEVRGF